MGLHGVKAWGDGAVGLPVVPEGHSVRNKELDLLHKLLLELGLVPVQLLRDVRLQLPKLLPRVEHVAQHICLLLGHLNLVPQQQRVHILDGRHDRVDLGLLAPELAEHGHDVPHILKVLHLPVQLHGGLPDVLHERVQVLPALGVQVLGILRLPSRGLGLERVLQGLGLHGQAADVVHGGDLGDLLLDGHVLLELSLKGVDVGAALDELLVLLLHVALPQKVVDGECLEVLQDGGLGALNAAREQQQRLDDGHVRGNEVEEGARQTRLVVSPELKRLSTA